MMAQGAFTDENCRNAGAFPREARPSATLGPAGAKPHFCTMGIPRGMMFGMDGTKYAILSRQIRSTGGENKTQGMHRKAVVPRSPRTPNRVCRVSCSRTWSTLRSSQAMSLTLHALGGRRHHPRVLQRRRYRRRGSWLVYET